MLDEKQYRSVLASIQAMYSVVVCLGAAFMYSYLKDIRSEALFQQMAQT